MGNDSLFFQKGGEEVYIMVEVDTHCHLITGVCGEEPLVTVGHRWSNVEKVVLGEPGRVRYTFIILNKDFLIFLIMFSLSGLNAFNLDLHFPDL